MRRGRAILAPACLGAALMGAALIGAAPRGSSAPAAQEEPAREAPDDPRATHPILARTPAEWPPTPEGRWAQWTPQSPLPDTVVELARRVARDYGSGDLPGALAAIFELLELEPGFPPALHQAGVIYFRLRRYGDAVTSFERYLEAAPARVADTRALGHGYYTLGEYDRARAHYARVLEVQPDSVEALRGYALAYMRLGETGRALELLRRVVELEPGHANAQAWIAQILFDDERTEEALEAATRARDLDPFEPRSWFLMSQILFDLGQDEAGEEAQARFELLSRVAQETRALEARLLYDPRQPGLLARLVELHLRTENHGQVKDALLRWMILAPDDVALRIHVLDVLWEIGDLESAADAAKALAEVGAEDERAWRRLTRYFAQTRDRLNQVRAEERAARLRDRDAAGGDGADRDDG